MKSGFFKKRKPSLTVNDQKNLASAAFFLGFGLPSLAILALGCSVVVIGGVMTIVPGPQQPIALQFCLVGIPPLAFGAASIPFEAAGFYVLNT